MLYNFVIRNGKTIDFETGQTTVRDIYVKDGLIAGPEAEKDCGFEIDAAGKYVLPGLIDEHVHVNYLNSNVGANADLLCIPMGITTAVDPGTAGWANFDGFYLNNIVRSTTSIYAYLHVFPYGLHEGVYKCEEHDPEGFNEGAIIRKLKEYPDTIKGLKVRMKAPTLGGYGVAPLHRAVEIARDAEQETGRRYPVAVHYDNLPDNVSLEAIINELRPGDILVHIMQNFKETAFDHEGRLRDIVRDAQKRGVLIDDSHGRIHYSFAHLRSAFADGFKPDFISSDVVRESAYVSTARCLIHAMNVDLAAGLDKFDVLKAVTYNPAKALGLLEKAGTLEIGRPADICVMDIRPTDMVYHDMWGGSCAAGEVFVPEITVKNGIIAFRQSYIPEDTLITKSLWWNGKK